MIINTISNPPVIKTLVDLERELGAGGQVPSLPTPQPYLGNKLGPEGRKIVSSL